MLYMVLYTVNNPSIRVHIHDVAHGSDLCRNITTIVQKAT